MLHWVSQKDGDTHKLTNKIEVMATRYPDLIIPVRPITNLMCFPTISFLFFASVNLFNQSLISPSFF